MPPLKLPNFSDEPAWHGIAGNCLRAAQRPRYSAAENHILAISSRSSRLIATVCADLGNANDVAEEIADALNNRPR